jgi:2-(1,2-epoxy-1,2-dihydrophenyl)acetyl-CoA isomerase
MITEMHGAETLDQATYDFAKKLASGPTIAQRHTKRLMDSAETRSLEQQLAEELVAGKACAATEDHKEGLAAAVERREPRFVGR